MIQAIGFANKFYTLWTIDTEPVYTTDVNGQHWLTGYNTRYTYHKNISFDLEKAKALHPTLEVHEDLRGKTSSWTTDNKEDLCPQIMKFGKHIGEDINELLEKDFQYIIWLCDNGNYSSNREYAKNLPKVQEHFRAIEKAIEDASNKLITDKSNAFREILSVGYYEFVVERNLRIHGYFAYININVEGLNIEFRFEPGTFSYNEYRGFEYGLPIVKGKAKRIKGKTVKFEFTAHKTEAFTAVVTNVTLLK